MKILALSATVATLGLAACSTIPENSKPYTCADYNAARAKLAKYSTPQAAFEDAQVAKFMKINYVGFRTNLQKHPGSREKVMAFIDDNTDAQAKQCRLMPQATIHYTAVQVTDASVRLGYMVDTSGLTTPPEVKTALGNLRMGKPVENESGLGVVKSYIQDCAAKSAPARVCRLSNL
ncbi:MAG: hypothetical protein DI585_03545 [Pseudomonas fluorescens]|nr:MAG: hypothetical protein DI585_03545 [Pseudomonas fluorescens]